MGLNPEHRRFRIRAALLCVLPTPLARETPPATAGKQSVFAQVVGLAHEHSQLAVDVADPLDLLRSEFKRRVY